MRIYVDMDGVLMRGVVICLLQMIQAGFNKEGSKENERLEGWRV